MKKKDFIITASMRGNLIKLRWSGEAMCDLDKREAKNLKEILENWLSKVKK